MSAAEIYSQLIEKCPEPTMVAEDESQCFEIAKVPALEALVGVKYPMVKYVSIDYLKTEDETVLNLTFYDAEGEDLAGAELTKGEIYWDDTA
jgi:hypothetical protein